MLDAAVDATSSLPAAKLAELRADAALIAALDALLAAATADFTEFAGIVLLYVWSNGVCAFPFVYLERWKCG